MYIRFFLITVYFFLIFGNIPIHAQSRLRLQEDASQTWEKIYADALRHLRAGTSKEKIQAAYVLGAQRNPRFLRPLLEELHQDLKPRDGIRIREDEPYVKSVIAWAIGHIGHPIAVPSMLKALDLSIQLAQAEIKRAEKLGAQKEALSQAAKQEGTVEGEAEQAQIWQSKGSRDQAASSGPFPNERTKNARFLLQRR